MKLKTALELLGDDHLGPFGWSDEEQRVGLTVSQLERFARRAREEMKAACIAEAEAKDPAPFNVLGTPVCFSEHRDHERIIAAIRALPTDPKP